MTLINKLDDFLDFAANEAIDAALSQDAPIVGAALKSLASEYAFQPLRDFLTTALAGVLDPTDPDDIAAALNTIPNVTASVAAGVVIIRLQASQSEDVTLLDQGVNMGSTAVGLSASADVTGSLDASLDVTLAYTPGTDMLVLDNQAGDEISISAILSADLAASATLGPIGLLITDTNPAPEISLSYGIDLAGFTPADITTALTGAAALSLRFETLAASGLLPSFFANLDVTWSPANPLTPPDISFGDVGIEIGSLMESITDVLDPLLDFLFTGVVGDVVDAITAPLPILNDGIHFIGMTALFDQIPEAGDDVINLLDIVGGYFKAQGQTEAYQALSVAAEVVATLQQLRTITATGEIVLGSFEVNSAGVASPVLVSEIGGKNPLDLLGDLLGAPGILEQALDAVQGLSNGGSGSFSDPDLTDESGLSFPLFENPERIVDILLPLLTGTAAPPVSIIEYDIPAFEISAQFGPYFFPIVGPIGVTMRGEIGAGLDFKFGYDTTSLSTGNFLDGLFIGVDSLPSDVKLPNQDPDQQYEHEPFIYSYAGIYAGVGVDLVVASVSVEGGLVGFSGAFLNGTVIEDTYDPAGTTDRTRLLGGCLFDPITGRLGAEIVGRFEINLFFYSFSWEVTFVEITLVDFSFGCDPSIDPTNGLARLSGDNLEILTGPMAFLRTINSMGTTDDAEHYRILNAADADGNAIPGTLAVQWRDMRQDFIVGAGGIIFGNLGEKNDSFAMEADVVQAANVSGGDGLDILVGALGDDTFNGNDGDDRLFGNAGNDALYGGAGRDRLEGGAGADTLDGGAGQDKVSYEFNTQAVVMELIGLNTYGVTGGEATGDVLISIEEIIGSNYDDVLYGTLFGDGALEGRDGNDALIGFAGDDLLLGGKGADLLIGGGGTNGTSYVSSSGGVRIDLATNRGYGGDAEGDMLYDIQYVQGSHAYDVLRGTSDDDVFFGFSGDDILEGRGGRDEIYADSGDDTVLGIGDGDTLHGGSGRDLLSYENAAAGGVVVNLASGVGTAFASPFSFDSLSRIYVDVDGDGPIPAAPSEYSTFEDLSGTGFADALSGDLGQNLIRGLAGNDTIDGYGGDDTLIGGSGADALNGGAGRDLADYAEAFKVNVSLLGGVGSGDDAQGDILTNIEDLRGTVGADTLIGNTADNRLWSGLSRGAEFQLAAAAALADGFDSVDGGDGRDTLILDWSQWDTGLGMTGSLLDGGFTRLATDGVTILDEVQLANIERLFVTGTFKADLIVGGYDDDQIYGGGGNDTLSGLIGADQVLAQEGDDEVIHYQLPGFVFNDNVSTEGGEDEPFLLDGGRGIDGLSLYLLGATRDLVINGPTALGEYTGINLITSGGGVARNFEHLSLIATGSGNDLIAQDGNWDNQFAGGDGEDTLRPGLGTDTVDGGKDYSVGDELTSWNESRGGFFPSVQNYNRVIENSGDLMVLDYATLGAAVAGTTNELSSGVSIYGLDLQTNAGSYTSSDGAVDLTFTGIERIHATGSALDDRLTGTHDSYRNALNTIDTIANYDRGDDILTGGDGNDTLIGFSGDDVLNGGASDDVLIGGDTNGIATNAASALDLSDPYEFDEMTGGDGADTFVLGIAYRTSLFLPVTSGSLYVGYGENDFALITDFNVAQGDSLQLAGSAADYTVQTFSLGTGFTALYHGTSNDLVAVLSGVDSLDLAGDYINYVGAGNLGQGFDGPTLGPILTPSFAFNPGSAIQAMIPSLTTTALPTLGLSAAQTFAALESMTLGTALMSTTASFALTAATGWVTQNNDPAALMAALFSGAPDNIDHSKDVLILQGDGRAFGTFVDDPFGLGSGIVLSTGQVEDLDEANEVDGGIGAATELPLTFVKIGAEDGRTIYRADLTGLGIDLNSLVLEDSNSKIGGATGIFSGFDLDAIALSRTLITDSTGLDLNDASVLPQLDVFNFTSAATQLQPGSQRSGSFAGDDFFGAQNGLISPVAATLGAFDASASTAAPQGWVTLGDGGKIGFDLTEAVATNRPLYLYVAETGISDGETLDANITASSGRLTAPSDLSTDFGAAGAADDTISMTYQFELQEGVTGGNFVFDFVFFSEELIEWAGSEFNDNVKITLNGIQLAELSDGGALDVNTLRPAPISASHPDFIWNPVGLGASADATRADGYTTVLQFAGAVGDGMNELKIEVQDVRDGILDSGVLIRGNSMGVIDPVTGGGGTVTVPGVSIAAAGVPLVEGEAPTAIAVTLDAASDQPVTLVFTPNADIDLGSGAGTAHMVVVNPGDPLTFDLNVAAVNDGITEGTEFSPVMVAVTSADADYNGLGVAPLIFSITDAPTRPGAITLGDAPTSFSRADPTAWADAWTHSNATITWKADIADANWTPVNLGTAQPGTFGGSGLSKGDLGVSGQSVASEVLPQEIDGTEALRIQFDSFVADSAIITLANFTTGDAGPGRDEAARLTFLDQSGTVLSDNFVFATDGNSFAFNGLGTATELVIQAGTSVGGIFIGGALSDGTPPTAAVGSGFLLDTLTFDGDFLF